MDSRLLRACLCLVAFSGCSNELSTKPDVGMRDSGMDQTEDLNTEQDASDTEFPDTSSDTRRDASSDTGSLKSEAKLLYAELRRESGSFTHWYSADRWVTDFQSERRVGGNDVDVSANGEVVLHWRTMPLRLERVADQQVTEFVADGVETARMSPDGMYVIWGDSNGFWLGHHGGDRYPIHDTPARNTSRIRWAPTSDYASVRPTLEGSMTTVSPDGGEITEMADELRHVQWSPDGQWIAWAVDTGTQWGQDIFVSPRDQSQPEAVLQGWEIRRWNWSPNSEIFGVLEAESGQWYRVGRGGGDPELISAGQNPDTRPFRERWSPDGEHLAYGCFAALCVDDLKVSPGTAPVPVFSYTRWHIAWSPDSSKIAFTQDGQLYLSTPTGELTGPVGTDVDRFSFAWSRDGSKIAYSDAKALVVADSDSLTTIASFGQWQVGPRGSIRWGPDDQELYFVADPVNETDRHVRRVEVTPGAQPEAVTRREAMWFRLLSE